MGIGEVREESERLKREEETWNCFLLSAVDVRTNNSKKKRGRKGDR